MRVSVTEYEDTETDDAFLVEREKPAEIDSPTSLIQKEDYFKLEERRFQEAAEKVLLFPEYIFSLFGYKYWDWDHPYTIITLDHETGTKSVHPPKCQQTEQLCILWVGARGD